MRKSLLVLQIILDAIFASLLFSSCILSAAGSQDSRIEYAQEQLTQAYNGTYSWISETKESNNVYIENFTTNLECSDGKIAAKLRYSTSFFSSDSNLVDSNTYISADYLCKVFADEEKALYEPLISQYFDDYNVVMKTDGRFCPVTSVWIIDEETGEETVLDSVSFFDYKLLMFHNPSDESDPINQNETDVYFVVRSKENLDTARMEAFFYQMMKNGYWINGKFIIADSDFSGNLSDITENTLTDDYLKNFTVYDFDSQSNFSYTKED